MVEAIGKEVLLVDLLRLRLYADLVRRNVCESVVDLNR